MTPALLMSADKELIGKVLAAAAGLPMRIEIRCTRIKTAMDAFQETPVKLAVIDYFLPDSTGIDALKSLKKVDESIVVILITRVHTRAVLDRAFRHGASDVLIYPASEEAIRDTLLHRLAGMQKASTVFFHQDQET